MTGILLRVLSPPLPTILSNPLLPAFPSPRLRIELPPLPASVLLGVDAILPALMALLTCLEALEGSNPLSTNRWNLSAASAPCFNLMALAALEVDLPGLTACKSPFGVPFGGFFPAGFIMNLPRALSFLISPLAMFFRPLPIFPRAPVNLLPRDLKMALNALADLPSPGNPLITNLSAFAIPLPRAPIPLRINLPRLFIKANVILRKPIILLPFCMIHNRSEPRNVITKNFSGSNGRAFDTAPPTSPSAAPAPLSNILSLCLFLAFSAALRSAFFLFSAVFNLACDVFFRASVRPATLSS